MRELLDYHFRQEGFCRLPTNLPEFTAYYRSGGASTEAVLLADDRTEVYLSQDQCRHIQEKLRERLAAQDRKDVHILQLVLTVDPEKTEAALGKEPFCWLIDVPARRLLVSRWQTPDFYGMRKPLEAWLAGAREEDAQSARRPENARPAARRRFPVVTISLALSNVVVFLICTFGGEILYNKGALDAERILRGGEYYRIVSAWFLHGSVTHLFQNMLILLAFGELVEKKLGHVRFGILYLIAGISGSLCSLCHMLAAGGGYVSIGASGAVFGVEGALLALVLLSRKKERLLSPGRFFVVLAYSLYIGFRSAQVDAYAHIGGAAAGFLTGLLLYFTGREAKDK